jgi:hypothetical protein
LKIINMAETNALIGQIEQQIVALDGGNYPLWTVGVTSPGAVKSFIDGSDVITIYNCQSPSVASRLQNHFEAKGCQGVYRPTNPENSCFYTRKMSNPAV